MWWRPITGKEIYIMEIVMAILLRAAVLVVAPAAVILFFRYFFHTPKGIPINVEVEPPADWDEWDREYEAIQQDVERFFREYREKESVP
jgi:hypothetical protein